MLKKLLGLIFAMVFLTGCSPGGGVADVFIDDPFFDDPAPELLAFDDQYSTFQNQALSVGGANGVLRNDFVCCDFEIRFPGTTASGGTVVGQDDGSFIYTPPQNFTGTDFFDYTLEDDLGTSIGNVIISVNEPPPQGFIVDSGTGNDGTGNGVSGAPFASIQAALNAAGANGTVVVRPGTGTYVGAINLQNGQTLVGADFQITPQGNVRPVLTGPVNMANGCTVRGLEIDGSGTVAIDAFGADGGEISQCDLTNTTGFAIDLDDSSGDWLVQDNLISGNGGGITAVVTTGQQLILEVSFNDILNSVQCGIFLDSQTGSDIIAGIFSNQFTGNQVGFSFEAQATGTASLCLDLSGNQSDDVYRLTRNGALFQVEEFSQLSNLNTGAINEVADAVQEVADGFCGF